MIPYSALRDHHEPSVLAQGANGLDTSVTFLRKTLRWFFELPPGVQEELREAILKPACNVPRGGATLGA
jgi:hypothetical protein